MLTGDVPVPRREPGRGGDEARARGAARRPDAPARGLERAGRGGRPRHRARTSTTATTTTSELIDDLEDALAIETARSGQATGEATAVMRTLPASARRRLPLRLRHGPLPRAARCCSAPRSRSAAHRPGRRTHRARRAGSRDITPPPARSSSRLAQAGAASRTTTRGHRRRAPRRGQARASTATRARPGRPRTTSAARSTASPASASTSTPTRPSPPARCRS